MILINCEHKNVKMICRYYDTSIKTVYDFVVIPGYHKLTSPMNFCCNPKDRACAHPRTSFKMMPVLKIL